MNENVNVCITPKGDKPVLHFSQFDNENVFTVTVLADDGVSAAVLTGLDIEFRIRKTDSHVVTIAPESVADNVITFKTTEQLCACCGQNIASVVLMKDDMVISTLDIFVDIQRDILSGGLTSESDIRNLTTQIEQIVPEVVGDDYYNKQEVDALLAEHTFDPTNYYNKSDVDGLLADKADSDDVYTKSDVYAKTEVNNLLSAKMDTIGYHGIVDDAAVISFTTDCNAPLDIIKGKITPVQSGSGTPSPSNVRPISGFSALNVTRTEKNLFNKATATTGAWVNAVGTTNPGSNRAYSDYIFIKLNTPYYFSNVEGNSTFTTVIVYDRDKNIIGTKTLSGSGIVSGTLTFTEGYYIRVNTNEDMLDTVQIELGNQATEYHAYNGQTATVNFGQTVYGGSLDVTNGKLTITHGYKTLDGTENWQVSGSGDSQIFYLTVSDMVSGLNLEGISNYIKTFAGSTAELCIRFGYNSNIIFIYSGTALTGVTDLASFKTYLSNNNLQICYTLATPIEIDTTPETVLSIAGDNNIFLDTGNLTEIAYFEDAKDNLIKLIKACQI